MFTRIESPANPGVTILFYLPASTPPLRRLGGIAKALGAYGPAPYTLVCGNCGASATLKAADDAPTRTWFCPMCYRTAFIGVEPVDARDALAAYMGANAPGLCSDLLSRFSAADDRMAEVDALARNLGEQFGVQTPWREEIVWGHMYHAWGLA